jgi:hypothetical protein
MYDNVRKERYTFVNYYVFNYDAYKLLSLGFNDMASRLLLLYSFYSQANLNIPSIDFNRLTKALDSVVALDRQNIQPYLHVAFYWIWAKKDESRKQMGSFMLTGVDRFNDNWDIAYAVYRLYNGIDDEIAIKYLRIAAERAIAGEDGPEWLIDLPAIMMNKNGETIEAILWLYEALKKTNNAKHSAAIIERIEKLQKELEDSKELSDDEPYEE